MALRNAKPLKLEPKTLSDSLDGTNIPKGSMSVLTNLVQIDTSPGGFECRPGAISLVNFNSSPIGFIQGYIIINGVVYGMYSDLGGSNKGIPFAYNLSSNAFVAISGTAGNIPPAQSATAGLVYSFDLISTKIIVCGPGFGSLGGGYFGVIDITTPTSPAWSVGTTAGNGLPSAPTIVKNFNNRAYFVCANLLYFSDVLVPTTITAATQFLTLGDTSTIIQLGTLPLSTTAGGSVSGLIAFKGNIIYQITGDLALSDLVLAPISVGVGTISALSVCNTPEGLAFIANDGLRFVNLIGTITPPIGADGTGISQVFINNPNPNTICCAFNVDILRISVLRNPLGGGYNDTEYWYDFSRKTWTGPHYSNASNITSSIYMQPYLTTFITASFINLSSNYSGLFQSDVVQRSSSVYTENSTQLTFSWQTSLLPDTELMSENCIIETSLMMTFGGTGTSVTVSFLDENQNVLDSITISSTGANLQQVRIPWTVPLVFKQGYVKVTGNSFGNFQIENLYLKYQPLGYLMQ